MLILKVCALLVVLATLATADSQCGDWEPFKDQKCYKILTKAGLQSFEDAEKSCKHEDSHLISVTFREEQEFLTNFLFTKNKLVDNVWTGAKYTPVNKLQWEDGSQMTYSNWKAGRPKNSSTNFCVQMDSDSDSVGKWVDGPCSRKNVVVCQKPQTWTFAKLQNTLIDALRKHQEELDELNRKLVENQRNPVPVGFIYAQLPKEKTPQEIWPWMTWTDISSTYDGVFFRVTGKDSADFGQIQEDNSPRITDVYMKFHTFMLESPEGYNMNHVSLAKGSKSQFILTGKFTSGTQQWVNFETSGGEVRPRNMAMRVWKRTG